MKFWIKQKLYRLGRKLIRLNYVNTDANDVLNLVDARKELANQRIVIHDILHQNQELRYENSKLKIKNWRSSNG